MIHSPGDDVIISDIVTLDTTGHRMSYSAQYPRWPLGPGHVAQCPPPGHMSQCPPPGHVSHVSPLAIYIPPPGPAHVQAPLTAPVQGVFQGGFDI